MIRLSEDDICVVTVTLIHSVDRDNTCQHSGDTCTLMIIITLTCIVTVNRLVGLVVKASASRAEDPGFESLLRRDFFGVESYQ